MNMRLYLRKKILTSTFYIPKRALQFRRELSITLFVSQEICKQKLKTFLGILPLPHILVGVWFQVLQDLFSLLLPVFSVRSYGHLPRVSCLYLLLFARLNTAFSSLFHGPSIKTARSLCVNTSQIQTIHFLMTTYLI